MMHFNNPEQEFVKEYLMHRLGSSALVNPNVVSIIAMARQAYKEIVAIAL